MKQMIFMVTMPIFIRILLLFVAILQGVLACPRGWVSYNSRCYLFVTHTTSDWNGARQYCLTQNSVLTEIGDATEDHFLNQYVHRYGHNRDFWIGGIKTRSTWMWASSHTSMRYYTNWGRGEPNNRYSEESCIELYHHQSYQWNDEGCNEHNYFICEQSNTWPVNTNRPYVPIAPTITPFWFTWQIHTDSPYVTSTTTTTKTSSTTTSSTTTTTTTVPQTTKPLQMVTLPRNPQNSQYTSCPSGWIRFDSSCYLFATDISYDWVESGHFCSLFGASLTSIETEIENNFIRQHLLNIAKPVDFWVGGTDIVKEGDWRWITSQKQITYSDWYPGKPSDFHHNVNCLELLHNYKYHWNDQDCNVVNHFICEIPNGPQPHQIFG